LTAPWHEEDQRLGDSLLGVDMMSCMGDDEIYMELSVTHFSYSQSPIIAMTHVDINCILDMVEEPCVLIEHRRHMDLQA
jgi:hypothetical protein